MIGRRAVLSGAAAVLPSWPCFAQSRRARVRLLNVFAPPPAGVRTRYELDFLAHMTPMVPRTLLRADEVIE